MGDILIAKKTANKEVKSVLCSVCSCEDLIVINDLEECIDLSKNSKWVVLYTVESRRFPCKISPDGFDIHSLKRFDLAKSFGVEIAWSSDNDPNPYKWHIVYPNGIEQTEFLEDEDIM
nr:hypothetical protein [uncultured Desulfobacter sp.]